MGALEGAADAGCALVEVEVFPVEAEEFALAARQVVAAEAKELSAVEYRWLACRLTEALTDALRVAESRGDRIPDPPENPGS
ncbi:hypothetical protein [Streptomyces sp. NPDC000931]|uniref:hypothetical protein n=1 Tax=Streptomyces sp. NPDC000931 TaxID=3154372 RepID=UPI00332C1883